MHFIASQISKKIQIQMCKYEIKIVPPLINQRLWKNTFVNSCIIKMHI